jgi:hypothetical protein
MLKNLPRYQIILFPLVFGVLVYLVAAFISSYKFAEARQSLETQISEQEALLTNLAETTGRNGADPTTDSILKDCALSNRTQFDTLLGNLDKNLPSSDLEKLQSLFSRCGAFYSQRKSLLASRLEREVEVYSTYVDQLTALSRQFEIDDYNVEKWRLLADLEQAQSKLFTQLVTLQDQIIKSLLTGKTTESTEITEILSRVKTAQKTLVDTNNQIAEVQTVLKSE